MASEYVTGGNVATHTPPVTLTHPGWTDTAVTTFRSTVLLTGALTFTCAWLMGSIKWWSGYHFTSTSTGADLTQTSTKYLNADTTTHMYWLSFACLIFALLLEVLITGLLHRGNLKQHLFDITMVPVISVIFLISIFLPTLLGLLLQVGLNHINSPASITNIQNWETTHRIVDTPDLTFTDHKSIYYVQSTAFNPDTYKVTTTATKISIMKVATP